MSVRRIRRWRLSSPNKLRMINIPRTLYRERCSEQIVRSVSHFTQSGMTMNQPAAPKNDLICLIEVLVCASVKFPSFGTTGLRRMIDLETSEKKLVGARHHGP